MDMTNRNGSHSFKGNLAGAAAVRQHAQLLMSFHLHDYLYQLVGVVVGWGSVGGECY